MRFFLHNSEKYKRDALIAHQNKYLRKIVLYSYQHVPYYRELFDNNGIKPKDILSVDDLKKIPFLTKKIVKERYEDLKSDIASKYSPFFVETSGTTGTPMKFYQDRNVNISKFAYFWRAWNWGGYKIRDKMVIIEGPIYEDGVLYKFDRVLNALRISNFVVSAANVAELVEMIVKIKPKVIRAYPSAIYQFTKLAEELIKTADFSFIKTIITVSENLLDYQRFYLERIYKCKVFDCYHSWESICMISECEYQVKHHHMEYGILEIIGEDDEPVIPGETGEMVATGFYNLAMPLIRYKTGDIGSVSKKKCNCGREHDVIENIDGRIDDVVVTPDGRRIGGSGLTNALKHSKGFDFVQIVQNELSSIDVKLVKNKYYCQDELQLFKSYLEKCLGLEIIIKFIFVEKLEKSGKGKIRYVINNYLRK